MDNEKVKKVFKKRGDRHEESKTPLQVMSERFIKGLAKERERKVVVPSAGIVKATTIPENLKKRSANG